MGLIASLAGLARPTLGVYGIAILCTLDALTRVFVMTGGIFRWNTVNYIMLMVIGLGFPVLIRRNDLTTRTLVAFFAFLAIELLMTKDMEAGVQHLLAGVSYFGLLIYFVRGTHDLVTWHWIALISNTVAAFGGLLYFLQMETLPEMNANAWAHFPLTALFSACLASAVPSNVRWLKKTIWVLVIINIVWVVLTGSRGGITIASCCLLYMVSSIPGITRRVMFVSSATILGLIVASQFSDRQAYVMHRIDKSVDGDHSLSSRTSGRSDLAIGGWRIFLKNPLFGVGTGGYAVAWKNLDDRVGMGTYAADRESEAHSGWVKTLAEGGLIGIALHIAFVLSPFLVGMRSRKKSIWQLGLLVTFALAVAFLSTEFQGKGLWYLAAGAAVVMQQQRRKRSSETEYFAAITS
ncbi:O-antigen ligase family protein [Novipirellula sp. SH528]|uniref:O-antigen ligase family protein n=1 Tax=Novipirellula sp. SH528 TaxID=3454466 RepID=UPI003F9F5B5C